MCSGPERSNSASSSEKSTANTDTNSVQEMSKLTVITDDCFSSLLELAADNDSEGFKRMVEQDSSAVDEVGLWLVRKKGSKQIVNEERTPLMVAATYGSVDVLKLIVSLPEVDLNRTCGPDKSTALHCATSGGAVNAANVVKLLLSAGADPNIEDANGQRPVEVIVLNPKLPTSARSALEELLVSNMSDGSFGNCNLSSTVTNSNSSSPVLSSSPENGSPSSRSDMASSPNASKYACAPSNSAAEKKEYPVDPSLPDIKNSIYATDEFRMFSFKVRPCSRAYSHDWTECPFVHPGENARRRDPRKFHYSCVPCPDFQKGACRRGDMCEYAHGVFECWLHPAQYRTRLCKDSTGCSRRVCFFAHTTEELRPLYVSTGSAVPSPRSAASAASVMDMATALNLLPGSPSSSFNQPMSPTANGMSHSPAGWPQPNVPTLHLPGSNLQSSRLRSSLSARDIPPNDYSMLQDFDAHQLVLNDLAGFPQPRTPNSFSVNRSGRSKTLTPSNLEELFSAEMGSSPRYSDQAAAAGVFSPSHKSAYMNQFQQQQNMLSPIKTNVFSPKNVEHPFLQASYGVQSPGRMSPRGVDPISPMSARIALAQREKHFQQLRSLSARDMGSNNGPPGMGSNNGIPGMGSNNGPPGMGSNNGPPGMGSNNGPPGMGSNNGIPGMGTNNGIPGMGTNNGIPGMGSNNSPGMGSPANSCWAKWGSPSGKADWSVNGVEFGQLGSSATREANGNGEEPDLSWVQSLVKDSSPEMKEKYVAPVSGATPSGEGLKANSQTDSVDHAVLGAWLEQMQLDQLIV